MPSASACSPHCMQQHAELPLMHVPCMHIYMPDAHAAHLVGVVDARVAHALVRALPGGRARELEVAAARLLGGVLHRARRQPQRAQHVGKLRGAVRLVGAAEGIALRATVQCRLRGCMAVTEHTAKAPTACDPCGVTTAWHHFLSCTQQDPRLSPRCSSVLLCSGCRTCGQNRRHAAAGAGAHGSRCAGKSTLGTGVVMILRQE